MCCISMTHKERFPPKKHLLNIVLCLYKTQTYQAIDKDSIIVESIRFQLFSVEMNSLMQLYV